MPEPRHKVEGPLYRAAFENVEKLSSLSIAPELKAQVAKIYEAEVRRFFQDESADTEKANEAIAHQYGFISADEMLATFFEWEAYKLKVKNDEPIPDMDPALLDKFLVLEKAVATVSGTLIATEKHTERSLLRILDHATKVVLIEAEAERTQNTDELTGLIDSPKFVAERIQVEVQQFLATPEVEVSEDEEVMVWAEIDLDDFKALNATYDHATVDFQILKPLAALLRETFRETDFICRLGGDELNIIFTRTKKNTVAGLGQKIIDVIHKVRLPEPSGSQPKPEQLTASVGLHVMDRAMVSQLDLTSPELVMNSIRKPADSATERAKFLGKDRYEIYNPDATEFTPIFEVYLKSILRKHSEEFRQMRHREAYTISDEFEKHLIAAARVAYEFKYHPVANT